MTDSQVPNYLYSGLLKRTPHYASTSSNISLSLVDLMNYM